MANEIVKPEEGGIPDWMPRKSKPTLGNLDASDIKPPQMKLLQGMSSEPLEYPGDAIVGHFWLAGANVDRGTELTGTLIFQHKSFVLWNPMKGDSKVPLAVASDGIHWDEPDQVFKVQFQNNPVTYTWKTGKTVKASGLDRFGSSRPDDKKSTPAASQTHTCLWAFPRPGGLIELAVIINSRTSLKRVRELFAMCDARGVAQYYQRYRILATQEPSKQGGFFYNYKYIFDGIVTDQEQAEFYAQLYERYEKLGLVSDLSDEVPAGSGDDDEVVMTRRGNEAAFKRMKDVDDIPF